MPGRLGARFAIEALFLIALAVGAAYADLERKWILLVMAGGWLVVALLELTADRIWAAAPPWRRPYYMAAPPPRAEGAAVPPATPAKEPVPEPEPEAATVIVRPVEPETQSEADAAAPSEEAPPQELPRPTLEPLEAAPKRRWFRRRKQQQEPAIEALLPEPPKHVRLLPPSGKPGSAPTELEDTFETTEREEHSRR
jgi:hypothetical protein